MVLIRRRPLFGPSALPLSLRCNMRYALLLSLASFFFAGNRCNAQTDRSPNRFRRPFDTPGRLASDETPSEGTIGGTLKASAVEVKHINMVEVPAKTEGVLTSLMVEEGDSIADGDTMAKIDDLIPQLTVELKEAEEVEARIKASDDVNLRDAKNNKDLADAESKSFEMLHEEGAVPYYDMRRKQLEAKKQGLRIELAEMDEKTRKVQVIIKQTELKMAKEEAERYEVTAPITGFVEERLAQKGQWVQAGTPIARVIQMDRLRVEGDLNGLQYPGRIIKGMPAKVKIYNSNDDPLEIDGQLGYVSMQMDTAGDHRVWVEIENRKQGDDWMIKPGMRADIIVKP